MDLNTIQTAISTLGFPIVIACFLLWFIWKLWMKSLEQNEKREEKLYQVIDKAQKQNEELSDTNSQFLKVLTDYKTDLETIKNDVADIKSQLN